MTDLRKLSEAATPGEWGFRFVPNQCDEGSDEYEVFVGRDVLMQDMPYYPDALSSSDAQFIVALVNAYRSGSLIPRPEYERVLALLAEAREWLDPTVSWELEALLSRIDDALAAEPEAKS